MIMDNQNKQETTEEIVDNVVNNDNNINDNINEEETKTIPYSRLKKKVDQYNQLKSKYDVLLSNSSKIVEYDQIKSKANKYKKELEQANELIKTFKDKEQSTFQSQYESKMSKLTSITQKDIRYEKIKPILPKFKLEGQLTKQDKLNNIKTLQIIESLGVFNIEQKQNIKIPKANNITNNKGLKSLDPVTRFFENKK